MHKKICVACIFTFFSTATLTAQHFGGNPGKTKWIQIDTDTARIIFTSPNLHQAQRIANVVHALARNTDSSIGNGMKKINFVLQNQTTIPNAYVRMAPFRSELYMTAGNDNFNTGSIRWDDNLSSHEYRHVQQFMNFNKGLTKFFSFLLGEEGQLFANGLTIPDYFFEGDAVFQETLVSKQGRGRTPFFFNEYKAIWQAKKEHSWMRLRNGSLQSLSPDHYQTGYMIVAYGYEKFGADFWKKITQDASAFKGFFYPFNKAIKKYTSISYHQFVKDALSYFKEKSISGNNGFYNRIQYVTGIKNKNVIDYYHPQFVDDDAIVALKKSFKDVPAFVIIKNNTEKKIRIKNIALDNYFSYRNGKIVYTAYGVHARWGWQQYSDIYLLDIKTGQQQKITSRGKYFSPDINEAGTKIIAAHVLPDGKSELQLINTSNGIVEKSISSSDQYFFTQTKFINDEEVVSAVRDSTGKMALITVGLQNGVMQRLTSFSNNLVGYPFVKNKKVFFSMMEENADKIFVADLNTQQTFRLTDNSNGIYQPCVNNKNEIIFSAVTIHGNRIAKVSLTDLKQEIITVIAETNDVYTPVALKQPGTGLLYAVSEKIYDVKKYKKSFQLFNFHSRRPVISPPEYGYQFFSQNMLNTFNHTISYIYNGNERSHKAEWVTSYGGWFPVIFAGASATFNRQVYVNNNTVINFNSVTAKIGSYIPLNFITGRTSQSFSLGGSFNTEQLLYNGIGKNIFKNRSFDYADIFMNFSSASQKAKQHIFPRWGQSFRINYRNALTFVNSYKFVATGNLFFPGLFVNHNLIIDFAYQQRDTVSDIFSNTFPFSRGYEALSTRKMYKAGFNYHLPLVYPDIGFANIVYLQRIRANVFFDYTSATARLNNVLQYIPAKTIGVEIVADGKIWNALPASIGLRYNHLLDKDMVRHGNKNNWEIILPVNLVPY